MLLAPKWYLPLSRVVDHLAHIPIPLVIQNLERQVHLYNFELRSAFQAKANDKAREMEAGWARKRLEEIEGGMDLMGISLMEIDRDRERFMAWMEIEQAKTKMEDEECVKEFHPQIAICAAQILRSDAETIRMLLTTINDI
jgi:hypothetical protein